MKSYSSFKFDAIFFDVDNNCKKFSFFRKGQIGDWVEYFNEEESKKVDKVVKEHLNDLIDFKFFPSR